MNKSGIKYPIKRIFFIDELAVILAFFTALLLRYRSEFGEWYEQFDGLYVEFFFVLCMLQVIVFLGYDRRKTPIFLQDPVDVFATVFKGKIILIVMALLYLYLNQI